MKKLILFLIVSNLTVAQNISFSVGADMRNAIQGSKPTNGKAALDLLLGVKMATEQGFIAGLNYENFKAIDFDKFGVNAGWQVELNKFTIGADLEYSTIWRKDKAIVYRPMMTDEGLVLNYNDPVQLNSSISFGALGANLNLQYAITENISIGTQTNALHRTDLDYFYGGKNYIISNYFKLIYKL